MRLVTMDLKARMMAPSECGKTLVGIGAQRRPYDRLYHTPLIEQSVKSN